MEPDSFQCSTCEIYLYGLANFQRHVNSLEHANRVQLKNLENITDEDKVNSSSNISSEQNLSYCNTLVKESIKDSASRICNLYLQCELCQMRFTGNEQHRQHLESAGHKKKLAMSPALNQNNLSEVMECKICNKIFSGRVPYDQHMISNTHQKKVLDKEWRQADNLFASFVAQHKTDIKSDISVNHGDNDLMINSSQANAMQCYPTQNNFAVLRCDICDKNFTGPVPYDQHMNSNIHLKKVRDKEILNRMQNQTCNVKSLLDNKENDMLPVHSTTLLKCELCDKSFSGPIPFDQHMNSLVHKKKIQDQDLLKKFQSTATYDQVDCVTDNVEMSVISNNCSSNNFKSSDLSENLCKPYQSNPQNPITANQTGSLLLLCEVCDKSFSGPIPFHQHMSSSLHQKKVLQKTPQLNQENNRSNIFSANGKNEIPNPQILFCKVCDKQFTGSVPYNQHKISDAHCKKVQIIEIEENLKEMEDAFKVSGNNVFNTAENQKERVSPHIIHNNSDLIFGDTLQDLNFITPETLNVTTFKVEEKIVFDIALK